MCSIPEHKTNYIEPRKTAVLRGQQAKRVSCLAWLTQNIERPREMPSSTQPHATGHESLASFRDERPH